MESQSGNTDTLLITVVICTYNRDAFLPFALESMSAQIFDSSKWELIIIDNNCTDNTATICKTFIAQNPQINVQYYLEIAQGLSHARNRGIQLAKGEYIAFIDDDAVAQPQYLKEIEQFIGQYPQAALIGGRIYPRFEGKKPRWVSQVLMPIFSVLNMGENERILNGKKYPVGANMIFKKDVFNQIGLFNPQLGRTGKNMMGGEEKDIYMKIRSIGGMVYYAPKPYVHHIIPISRATKTFLEKQAIGVGMSEKARVWGNKLELVKSSVRELAKWAATFALALMYVISLQFAKAQTLIQFRYWVSKGLWGTR